MEYIPRRGDIIWISFDPTKGHEQGGERPAIVISNTKYNDITGLVINCPITKSIKGYVGEISLPEDISVKGVVLTDHIRNLDWCARKVRFSGEQLSSDFINKILKRLAIICSE